MTEKPKTKLVEIELAALTRVCWSATVEVPEDFDDDTLGDVVEQFNLEIDGGEYWPDTEYWEKGSCHYRVSVESVEPQYRVDQLLHIDRITAEPGTHCPAEACPGVIEPCGECSHCGRDYIEKQGKEDPVG